MRIFLSRLLVLAGVILFPASAFAQASIAGSTRDASGAVLPGVTVEASSPALIEKPDASLREVRRADRFLTTSYIRPGRLP
jgi:hypothetical protein